MVEAEFPFLAPTGSAHTYSRNENAMSTESQDNDKRAEILRNLVEYRKNSGMRQSDVAAAMDIKQPAVSQLERGETSLKLETLQRYARAIGSSLVIHIAPDTTREDND